MTARLERIKKLVPLDVAVHVVPLLLAHFLRLFASINVRI